MKIRSFIAINLPAEIKKEIEKILNILKKAGAAVKWVRKENVHLTLHFLGSQEEEKLEEVKKVLEKAAEEIKTCFLRIEGIDCFPNRLNPRIIFLKCQERDNLVSNFQKRIGERLEAMGIEIDKRPFRLHLTLGRVKRPGLKLPQIKVPDLSFEVKNVELMKSELNPQGPIYSVIKSFPFKPNK